jgi:hypothetical protein
LLELYYDEYRKAVHISVALKLLIVMLVGAVVLRSGSWLFVAIYVAGLVVYIFLEGNLVRHRTRQAKLLIEREKETARVPVSTGPHKRRFALEDDSEQAN